MRPDESATPVAGAWLGADHPLLWVNGCWTLGPVATSQRAALEAAAAADDHDGRTPRPRPPDESTWYPAATSRVQTPS